MKTMKTSRLVLGWSTLAFSWWLLSRGDMAASAFFSGIATMAFLEALTR